MEVNYYSGLGVRSQQLLTSCSFEFIGNLSSDRPHGQWILVL